MVHGALDQRCGYFLKAMSLADDLHRGLARQRVKALADHALHRVLYGVQTRQEQFHDGIFKGNRHLLFSGRKD